MDTLHAAALKDTANSHTHKKKSRKKRKKTDKRKKKEKELFTRPQESKRADASSTGAHNEQKEEE